MSIFLAPITKSTIYHFPDFGVNFVMLVRTFQVYTYKMLQNSSNDADFIIQWSQILHAIVGLCDTFRNTQLHIVRTTLENPLLTNQPGYSSSLDNAIWR